MPAGIFYIVDTMKQAPWIDCGESRLRSALKIAGGSLSGGGSLGGPSLYFDRPLNITPCGAFNLRPLIGYRALRSR